MMPKYRLLYFKNLLDATFYDFFSQFNDQFVKTEDGKYQLVAALDQQALQKFFIKSVEQQLKVIANDYDIIDNPDITIIVGSCSPRDNFLLKFKDDSSFPKKLADILRNDNVQLKYVLKEKDILIDIVKFNQACISTFNSFFSSSCSKKKPRIPSSIMFVTHKNLDCYSMYKVLKFIFGRKNCVNLHEQIATGKESPIVATNDLIDKHVKNKVLANKDPEFKRIVKEVEQYVRTKEKEMKNLKEKE